MSPSPPAALHASPPGGDDGRLDVKGRSPVFLFAFLYARVLAGSVRRRLRRLKEPRYLLGTAFAILYFAMVFGRPGRRAPRGLATPDGPIREAPPELLLVLAFGITLLALLGWVFRSGRVALPLSEAEVQFLFPAPLTRRSVLRYALLRGQLGILFGSLLIALLGRGGAAAFFPAWLLLSVFNLHAQAISFTKARWQDAPAGRRAALRLAAVILPAGALALAIVPLLDRFGTFAGPSFLVEAGKAVLLPGRLLVEPLFRPALLPLLFGGALVVLHFLFVERSAVRFEEGTLALAARRAELRRQGFRAAELPSDAQRARVPFQLSATGAPEAAILWKNLLAVRRTPLARVALYAGAFLLVLFAASAAFVARQPDALLPVQMGVLLCAGGGAGIALLTAMAQREDFRNDLVYADVLRTWPVSAPRIAAGELGAPMLAATLRLLLGLGAALALSLGGAAGMAISRAYVSFPGRQELVLLAKPASILPWLLAAFLVVLPLCAILLVIQNATTLAFPDWFPPGPRRQAGPEVTGMRIIAFLATALILGLALVPSALLAGVAAWLGRGLGPAFLPALAVPFALPLALEAAAGVFLLGNLLERYDPAAEAA